MRSRMIRYGHVRPVHPSPGLGVAFVAALAAALATGSAACGDTAGSGVVGPVADAHAEDVGQPPRAEAGTKSAPPKKDAATLDEAGPTKPDAAAPDASASPDAAPPRDHGDASSTYPAFTADVPGVQDQGGPTLAAPVIVTVTWPEESNASSLEEFGDVLGASPYWKATTSEYGVGPAASGPVNHVRLTEQPINVWSDAQLESWLSDHVTNYAMYGLPAPTASSIYTLYLSTSTDLTVQGSDGCQQGIGGYHSSFVLAGRDVTYAVILQCNGADLRAATSSASHELVEASTDPHPQDVPAYYGFDSAHLAWDVWQSFQDELADACEFYYGPSGSFYDQVFALPDPAVLGNVGEAGAFDAGTLESGALEAGVAEAGVAETGVAETGVAEAGLTPDVGPFDAGTVSFNVQRSWSNASAAAGHAPCVPAIGAPYFSVTPLDTVNISLNLTGIGGGANAQTQGYAIAKGQTKTFAVGFHSDGPTSGPWTIAVSEGNPLLGGSPTSHVTATIDTPTGVNGDIAYVTVTVNSVDATMNGELLTITSQLAGSGRNFLPLLISNE